MLRHPASQGVAAVAGAALLVCLSTRPLFNAPQAGRLPRKIEPRIAAFGDAGPVPPFSGVRDAGRMAFPPPDAPPGPCLSRGCGAGLRGAGPVSMAISAP